MLMTAAMRDAAAFISTLPSISPSMSAAAATMPPVSKPVTTSMSFFIATLDKSDIAVPATPKRICISTAKR